MEVLSSGTKMQLDSWVGNFGLKTTTVRDPDNMPNQTTDALVRREYSYVVDLSNMKILTVYIGTTDGSMPNGVSSSLHEAMDQVLSLLGAKSG